MQTNKTTRTRPANTDTCRGWRQFHWAKGVIVAITSDQLYLGSSQHEVKQALNVLIIPPDATVQSASTNLACILSAMNPVILPRLMPSPHSRIDSICAQLGFTRFFMSQMQETVGSVIA